MTHNSIEIGDDLTDHAFKELKVGDVLRFKNEGGETELRITNMNKATRKCWVRPVKTFTPEELDGTVKVVDEK